jgi:hypothetical protein
MNAEICGMWKKIAPSPNLKMFTIEGEMQRYGSRGVGSWTRRMVPQPISVGDEMQEF